MSLTSASADIRGSMASLPRAIQPFLTWLTGKPLPGEQPLITWTIWGRLLTSTLVLLMGVGIGLAALHLGGAGLLLLLPSWLITTGALRYHYIVIGHYAAHGTLTRRQWLDRLIAETLSTFALTIPFEAYKRDHAIFHHSKRLGTPHDPDARFLIKHGFGPGHSMMSLRRRFRRALASPKYHAEYMKDRLVLNLMKAGPWRRAFAWLWLLGSVGIAAATGALGSFALVWLVPVVVGFQMSALFQFLSEHRWLIQDPPGKERLAKLTFGRFLGDPYPQAAGPGTAAGLLRRRARWWMRLVFLHLPARLFVLVGDLPQHDHHHRRIGNWENAIFAREADRAAGNPGWPTDYEDRWGSIFDHIDVVFREWAQRGRLTARERLELEDELKV